MNHSSQVRILVLTSDRELEPAIADAVDELGRLSAVAQELTHPITSTELFRSSQSTQQQQQQRLYIAFCDDRVVGLLKTGTRHLFYVDRKGAYSEMDPRCVLDFFVREDVQRRGVGLALFQSMLQNEQITARKLAYDRPSPKLMAFLCKHSSLTAHFPQPNRFVVFDDYFLD
ncbi:hypothetical protein PINS_up004460 [Pythium insidiosum]|nr:hypothetical protein PINS_up004460 [Pythium insidiosum]